MSSPYQQQVGISKLETGGNSINSTKIAEFILNSLLNQFMKKANEVISLFAQDIFEPVFFFQFISKENRRCDNYN
jgi:hypothetical protein